jgi:hypothetical protein
MRRVMAGGIAALAAAATILVGAGAGAAAASAAGKSPAASSGSLYFVRGVNIMAVPVGGGAAHKITNVGNGGATGMTVVNGKVFWVTLTGLHGTLSFASKNGGPAHVLLRNLNTPRGLASADNWLFWVDDNAIGRVRPNGTGLNRKFIKLPPEAGGGVADGLTADGGHLFFSRCQGHEIGRVNLNGSHIDLSFIKLSHKACPQGLGVGNNHVYWADLSGFVGRATFAGHGANGSWLNIHAAGEGPFNVAADRVHVYWDWGGAAGSPVHVGRATVSGTGLSKNFLTGQGAFALTSPGARP